MKIIVTQVTKDNEEEESILMTDKNMI